MLFWASPYTSVIKDENMLVSKEGFKLHAPGFKHNEQLRNVATKEDIADLRTELKEDIASLKIDMIKWIIGLLIAQTAILLTLVKFIT